MTATPDEHDGSPVPSRTPIGAAVQATERLTTAWRQWMGHLGSGPGHDAPVAAAATAADAAVPERTVEAQAAEQASPVERAAPAGGPGDAATGGPGRPSRRPVEGPPLSASLTRTAADHLLALANIARFEWDIPSGRVHWVVVPIHDETLASVDHIDGLLRQCHPADIDRLRHDMQSHVRGRQAVARSEFRLRTVRGTWRWHALCGRVVDTDEHGEARRFAGLVQDIDERRRAMQVRSTQDALFADGPVRLVTLGAAVGASPRDLYADLATFLGGGQPGQAGAAGTLPRRLRDVVHPDDVETLSQGVDTARAHPGRPAPIDLRVADGFGGWRRVRLQLAAERETAAPPPAVEGAPAAAPAPVLHAYLLDADDPSVAPRTDDAGGERLQAVVAQLGTMQRFLQDLQRLNETLQMCDGEAQARELVAQAAATLFPAWAGEIRLTDVEGHSVPLVRWGEGDDEDTLEAAAQARADAVPPPAAHQVSFPMVVGTQHGMLVMRSLRELDETSLRNATWAAASFAESLGLSLGNVRLREQAVQDWLTGLYNRRWFDEALRRESRRAQRSGEGLTLAILDVDHFKSFNDAFGHDAGDEVLRAVAREMMAFGRASDTPCRIGGEEMAVIMPRARIEDACLRLQELRERIASLRLEHEGVALPPVTVSIGVADCVEGRAGNLHRRADMALYAAKHGGRNCVRCWEPGMEDISGFAALDTSPSSLGL